MKSLRKFLLGGAVFLALSLTFFSCSSDTDEDEDLTVSITHSGTTTVTVTMTASSTTFGDSNTTVYIAYTLDGSEPNVDKVSDADLTKVTSSTSISDLKQYVDYGSAEIYESYFSLTETTTVKAKAFYIAGGKLYYGTLASTDITITQSSSSETSSSSDSDSNAYGDLTFSLASSGNSLSTHYFGSPDKTFTYTDTTNNNATVEHCYYQFQFSYKKNGAGNWFLYIRQIGAQKPIGNSKTGKTYLTSGTYTCDTDSNGVFNGRESKSVNNGTFSMFDNAGGEFDKDIQMTDSSFTLEIGEDTVDTTTGTVTTKGNLTTAIENAK